MKSTADKTPYGSGIEILDQRTRHLKISDNNNLKSIIIGQFFNIAFADRHPLPIVDA